MKILFAGTWSTGYGFLHNFDYDQSIDNQSSVKIYLVPSADYPANEAFMFN